MRPVRSRSSSVAALLAGAAIAISAVPVTAAPDAPSVRLIAPWSETTAYRWEPGAPAWFDPGVLVAAAGGHFELIARSSTYGGPVRVWQRVHDDGSHTDRLLPEWVATGLGGLRRFFTLTVRDLDGDVRLSKRIGFCPQGEDTRLGPNGPFTPRYPRFCSAFPFSRGTVWGIDRGWAVNAFGWSGLEVDLPNGRYRVAIAISEPFRDLFGVAAGDGRVTMDLRVRTETDGCPSPCEGVATASRHDADRVPQRGPMGVAPATAAPSPDTMPDLVALPAWNITLVDRPSGRSFVEFAATVWNAGPAPLLVEGYRREDEDVMDAYQYFLRDGDVVGRARVGTMKFDTREGHHHWHFKQFARYSLLDASRSRAVVSRKEAFCLAPTDAVDLTVAGAIWRPQSTGLGSACGGETSVWIREVLPAGWGDTYYQVAGQSLEVTDLPNGTYYVAVEADPTGLLKERRDSNNLELREIILGGRRGDRTVTVPAWNGVDA